MYPSSAADIRTTRRGISDRRPDKATPSPKAALAKHNSNAPGDEFPRKGRYHSRATDSKERPGGRPPKLLDEQFAVERRDAIRKEFAETLLQGRLTKAAMYAAANVAEYWILNLRDDVVGVFRRPDPATRRYLENTTVRRGERLALVAFPDASVAVDDLLPGRA